MRTAQEDGELFNWLCNCDAFAGDFLKTLAQAGLRADWENYELIRPVLLAMKRKYPAYNAGQWQRGVKLGDWPA